MTEREPYCPDHSFTGTTWWYDEISGEEKCVRCVHESRLLDEAGL